MSSASAARFEEGKQLVKEGRRAESTGLFKWTAEWGEACICYKKALKLMRTCLVGSGNTAKKLEYIEVLKMSAHANEMMNTNNQAARDMEEAGNMILTIEDTDIKYATVTNANFVTADEKEKKKQDRQKLKNGIADDSGKSKMERAFQYLSQSAMYYQINSQFDKAAKVLVRAGETIGDTDTKQGLVAMQQACTVMEESDRGMTSNNIFKSAIQYAVQHELWDDAHDLLERQIIVYGRHTDAFQVDMFKNALSRVILYFHCREYEKAVEYQAEACDYVERYVMSEEAEAADTILAAYKKASNADLREALQKSVFKYVANCIARLTRKMAFDEDVVPGNSTVDQDQDDDFC